MENKKLNNLTNAANDYNKGLNDCAIVDINSNLDLIEKIELDKSIKESLIHAHKRLIDILNGEIDLNEEDYLIYISYIQEIIADYRLN